MALIIAKTTASKGTGKIVSGVTKWGGAAVLGTSAFAGRQVLGRAGDALAQSEKFENLANSQNSATARVVGRLALRGGDKLRTGSFDARASRLGSTLTETTGVNLGKAQKDGFQKRRDAAEKKKAEREEKLYGGVASEEKRKEVKEAETGLRTAINNADSADGVTAASARAEYIKNAEVYTNHRKTQKDANEENEKLTNEQKEIDIELADPDTTDPKEIGKLNKRRRTIERKIRENMGKIASAEVEIERLNTNKLFLHGRLIQEAQDDLKNRIDEAKEEEKSAKVSFLEYRKNRAVGNVARRLAFGSDARVAQNALRSIGKTEDQKMLDLLKKLRDEQEKKDKEDDKGKGSATSGGASAGTTI